MCGLLARADHFPASVRRYSTQATESRCCSIAFFRSSGTTATFFGRPPQPCSEHRGQLMSHSYQSELGPDMWMLIQASSAKQLLVLLEIELRLFKNLCCGDSGWSSRSTEIVEQAYPPRWWGKPLHSKCVYGDFIEGLAGWKLKKSRNESSGTKQSKHVVCRVPSRGKWQEMHIAWPSFVVKSGNCKNETSWILS